MADVERNFRRQCDGCDPAMQDERRAAAKLRQEKLILIVSNSMMD
jgi:hypothetical protein